MALRSRLRRVSQKSQLRIKRFFGKTLPRNFNKNFTYQINVKSRHRKVKRNSQRGIL